MSVEKADVVIVGAGLAGLACARGLTSRGLDVLVLEAGDAVGGRVRTDHVDGYTLDRGFQVLNTGYPEVQRVVDLAALDLRPFDPAAGVRVDGERVVLANPVRRPSGAAAALGLPVGGIGGKAALGLYAGLCATLPVAGIKHRDEMSAAEAWRRASIPQDVVDGVLRPFFAGVLLEQDLSTTRRFTDLMMRMFVRGESTVPAGGMQALPEQLAARLPGGHRAARHPACARSRPTGSAPPPAPSRRARWWSPPTAGRRPRLLPGGLTAPPARGVTTVYHAAPDFPEATATLLLDAAVVTGREHDGAVRGGAGVRPARARPGRDLDGARHAARRRGRRRRARRAGPAARHRHHRLGAGRDLRPAAGPARHARAAPAAQAGAGR